MFTGLIEKTGCIKDIQRRGNGARITISTSPWGEPLVLGESIAVSGACLTVSDVISGGFTADVLKETLELTALGNRRRGATVNLERALKAGDRMGGHIVSGHVDGVGSVESIRTTGDDHVVRVSCQSRLIEEVIVKGSVALEGISLTVTAVGADWFEVHIIPTTWRETSLAEAKAGEVVNIETDVIAKYVRKYTVGKGRGDSILATMKRAGFS